ncbi:MAG: lysophospholipid acyltransferase family protein [Beijerinckiaceae bacterium]
MSKTKSALRYRLDYAGFRVLAGLVRALPLETASRLSGKGWRAFAPFLSRHKRAVRAIAAAFPDKDQAWCDATARAMWDNLGRVFAEGFHLSDIWQQGRVVLEEAEEFRAALGSERRFVFVGAHLGNWEVAAATAREVGASVCGVYQRIHNPHVEQYVRSLREPLYPAGLFPKHDNAGRKVMIAIRNGASLTTMGDLRDWFGPSVPFFGRPAPSNVFPALMARSFGIPLFAVVCARVPEGDDHVRFRVRLVRVDVPVTDDRMADATAATASLQAAFETFIREYPGQWMWVHRRWG